MLLASWHVLPNLEARPFLSSGITMRLPEFIRFCIVGGLLFMFDAALLELLVHCGLHASTARLISLAVALQVAYIAHGRFSFRAQHHFSLRTWLGFLSANALGACVNYAVFIGCLQLMDTTQGTFSRLLPLVSGTITALIFNYAMNRRYVFRRKDF